DGDIHQPLTKYFELGCSDVDITELLKLHYDTTVYGLREVISCLLNAVEPDKDQHDKWGQFGLWLHAGLEVFSGKINWLKIWWTNKNPRLIAKYYIDMCRWIGGVPIITQSNPGMENYGVANTHTTVFTKL
ncbi:hypothetical protein L208DRAFT_1126754, partial [Tricholoma matsutake]